MWIKKVAGGLFGTLLMGFMGGCGFLYVRQQQVIYYPSRSIDSTPGSAEFQLPYEEIQFNSAGEPIVGWWMPVPTATETLDLLPNEPRRSLKQPKTLLYFCGVGPNMGAKNYLSRMKALRQLGFSVLIFDYRGYGRSADRFPNEQRIYEDANAAWNYLTQTRGILPQDIVIYGESMGGAVAIDLARRQPLAHAAVIQSSFTNMAAVIKRRQEWYSYFPIDLLLTEKFDSIAKVKEVKVPLLFLHGTDDRIVPFDMSETLYAQASQPKELFLIDQGAHVRIYSPQQSYLKAIQQFLDRLYPGS
jgi:uncharacterized protein